MKRLWFLPHGSHLCRGWAGFSGDECGYKTAWVWVPGGVLVFRLRRWRWEEILAEHSGNELEAQQEWDDYRRAREEDGE